MRAREREGGGERTKIELCFITLLYSSHLQVLLQYFHKSTCVTFIVYMIMHDSGHHRYSNNSACDLVYTTNLSCFNASCTHILPPGSFVLVCLAIPERFLQFVCTLTSVL